MITIVSIVVFAVQLMFVFNFFYSIWKGRKVRSVNPWGATTLEWTTPINPGHGNWPGDIPEVHRWAYDYSKDGRDFHSTGRTGKSGRIEALDKLRKQ
jgi:cytochrome c oxidase subunit 1